MEEKKEIGRDTVGKISSRLLMLEPESRDPIELQRAIQEKTYLQDLIACIESGKKMFPSDFYIVHVSKKERLMENVIRGYFIPRLSCPTPQYDEAVYKYFIDTEHVQFLWVLPSKDTCYLFRDNAHRVVPEERELLKYILEFYDGTLLLRAKQMNGEREDSILLE